MSGLRHNNWNAACKFQLDQTLRSQRKSCGFEASQHVSRFAHASIPKASPARSEVAQTFPGARPQQHHKCQGLSVVEPWSQVSGLSLIFDEAIFHRPVTVIIFIEF